MNRNWNLPPGCLASDVEPPDEDEENDEIETDELMNTNQQLTTTKAEPIQKANIKTTLAGEYFRQQVKLCLPKHITPERFCRVAISAVTRTPKLMQCSQESVLKCMLTCSELGIEPDGRRAHLIPFGNECTLIVDYKGLVELAKRSGDVSSIFAQTVCANDEFVYDTGEVTHKIDFKRDRGEMYAVYAVINFKDGGKHTEVMTKAEVDRIRNRSRAKSSGPWVTDYDEMAKKTVFRRASKWIVLSPEVQEALDKEADTTPTSHALVADAADNLIQLPEATEEPQAEAAEAKTVELQPEPTQATERKPEPEKIVTGDTVQNQLAKIVMDGGFTFEHFKRWAKDTGNIEDIDDKPGFEAIHTRQAERFIRAKAGLLKSLAEVKASMQ